VGRGLQWLHDKNVIVKNVSLVQYLTTAYRASSLSRGGHLGGALESVLPLLQRYNSCIIL